jgi:hypothetical protein
MIYHVLFLVLFVRSEVAFTRLVSRLREPRFIVAPAVIWVLTVAMAIFVLGTIGSIVGLMVTGDSTYWDLMFASAFLSAACDATADWLSRPWLHDSGVVRFPYRGHNA